MWQDLNALHLRVHSMNMPDQLRFYVYKQTLKQNDVLVFAWRAKSGLIEIFHRDFDVGGEGNEFYDDDDDIGGCADG